MNWNVLNWDQMNGTNDGRLSYRNLMMDAISQQSADVLCLQEFFEPVNAAQFKSNLKEMSDRGFIYQYFYPSNSIWDNAAQFGMAILSRFPIVDTASLSFGKTPHSEGLMYADIKANNKIVRVYSIHLESFRSGNQNAAARNQGIVGRGRGMISGVKQAYYYRTAQVQLVRQAIEKSPYPVILSGNLGDVPGSYAYFNVRNKLGDAFLERGSGIGATINSVLPNLRVDYVFSDPEIRALQFYQPNLRYSDHYPIIVDFQF
jgi:endonuclease/exonuclease/phosphatase family metal-dependent hydrolase